jgi:cytochrome c biogenesis protein CcmG, thiol:disulfide interchange protein DsbE
MSAYPRGVKRFRVNRNRAAAFLVSVLLTIVLSGMSATGEQIAGFTMTTVDGKHVTIGELLKKGPVLVAFWALWCKSCKEELQAIDTILTDEMLAHATVVAVTIDSPRSIMRVKSYIAARKMKFLFCTDPNTELFKQLGGKATPYTVIIGPDRTIIHRSLGYAPGDERGLLEFLRTDSVAHKSDTPEPPERKK